VINTFDSGLSPDTSSAKGGPVITRKFALGLSLA
jgi:hypothetical protein